MDRNLFLIASLLFLSIGCGGVDSGENTTAKQPPDDGNPLIMNTNANIIFLHHSTGGVIWDGGVANWLNDYNQQKGTGYRLTARVYPKEFPYGWNNYPYDYWNIWVNHAGDNQYMEEDTLEILTHTYDVIVWKHCFPVSDIQSDTGSPNINSSTKSIENYKLQYAALKQKMHSFPNNVFIVWTGAALVQSQTTEDKAIKVREFFQWVKNNWDQPNDNIYVWDFFELETDGGIYLASDKAVSAIDSHPNNSFANEVAPLFARRLANILEGRGDVTSLTGQ